MRRRTVLTAAGAGLASMAAAQGATKGSIIAVRTYSLRNTAENQRQRLSDFMRQSYMPAAQRAGVTAIGFFTGLIAPGGPFITSITSYPSLAAMETAMEKLAADKEYEKAAAAFHALPGLSYMRSEASLLRGFESMPTIETPPSEPKRAPRVFELRTYESNTLATLRRKIKMFDDGEIGIFRRLGMIPIFFGETLFGRNMPNLTYMLAFDDLAAREKAWRAFGADPEWQKMRAMPGVSDPEVVSNSSNIILGPLPFSPIR